MNQLQRDTKTTIIRDLEHTFCGLYVERIEITSEKNQYFGDKSLYLRLYFSHDYIQNQSMASVANLLYTKYYQFSCIRLEVRNGQNVYPNVLTLYPGKDFIQVNNNNKRLYDYPIAALNSNGFPVGFVNVPVVDYNEVLSIPQDLFLQVAEKAEEIVQLEPEPEATPAPPFEETIITLDDLF